MRLPGTARDREDARPPGLAVASLKYTALRLGMLALAFLVAAAVILPSTSGAPAPRLLICAVIGAVASVPLSLFFGRRLRGDLTAALLASREERDARDREYDERVRAARRGPAGG